NYYTTDHGALMKDSRLVQVDINPAAIGNIVHPDAAIVSDAGPAAKKIHYWLDEAEIPPSGFTKDIGAADLRHYPDPPDKTPEGRVNYVRALQALDAALPDNRIFVTDVGRFMLEAWVRIRVSDPSSFVPATNFTSIGLGLPEAIGAAVAAPDRPVLAVCGDGGFMMGAINELHTAIRLGLDLVVVVANDGAYGAEHIQFANRQMDPASSHLEWPSLTGVAAAMGAKSFAVTSDETLTEAVAALSDRKGVVLIELMLDPGDMPIPRV
ncbi:MAG: thiamine pyrophosphate-dependent enzyme, partial [Pseudomonadota bacterium]